MNLAEEDADGGMEQRLNEGAEKTGDPRENPPTNDIVRHDPHMRKSENGPRWDSNPVRTGARRNHNEDIDVVNGSIRKTNWFHEIEEYLNLTGISKEMTRKRGQFRTKIVNMKFKIQKKTGTKWTEQRKQEHMGEGNGRAPRKSAGKRPRLGHDSHVRKSGELNPPGTELGSPRWDAGRGGRREGRQARTDISSEPWPPRVLSVRDARAQGHLTRRKCGGMGGGDAICPEKRGRDAGTGMRWTTSTPGATGPSTFPRAPLATSIHLGRRAAARQTPRDIPSSLRAVAPAYRASSYQRSWRPRGTTSLAWRFGLPDSARNTRKQSHVVVGPLALAFTGIGTFREFISGQSNLYVQHVNTEVSFAIGSQFIRHDLDDSEPMADIQRNNYRYLFCPGGRGVVAARLPASHQDEPGSNFRRGRSLDLRTWESWRAALLVGGFSSGTSRLHTSEGRAPVPPTWQMLGSIVALGIRQQVGLTRASSTVSLFHFGAAPYSHSSTLICSYDPDVKSQPYLWTKLHSSDHGYLLSSWPDRKITFSWERLQFTEVQISGTHLHSRVEQIVLLLHETRERSRRRLLKPLVHTEIDASLVQSSLPTTLTADNQCAFDIDIFAPKNLEPSPQVIELANYSVETTRFVPNDPAWRQELKTFFFLCGLHDWPCLRQVKIKSVQEENKTRKKKKTFEESSDHEDAAASSGTIPTCENPATRPGIEPGSPWWEGSVLIGRCKLRKEEGLEKESAMDFVRDPYQHSPGAISENHGRPKSGWSDQVIEPGSSRMNVSPRPEEFASSMTCSVDSAVLVEICRYQLRIGCLLSRWKATIGPAFSRRRPTPCGPMAKAIAYKLMTISSVLIGGPLAGFLGGVRPHLVRQGGGRGRKNKFHPALRADAYQIQGHQRQWTLMTKRGHYCYPCGEGGGRSQVCVKEAAYLTRHGSGASER
ncbi:hypothetical protein PR048_033380 [Dryococelus australis]|uniref:Uncharacterized protein n=1 Tax=Dryococelus australis TaxID=614101 RepID=A0ABQ9G383_9NEOP|nr:hypothetical protein PR048_033380 [Dryococelus australis]